MDKLDFRNFTLDMVSRKLFVSGKYIYLRNKEFCLLEYFIRNMGKVLTRTIILEDVWDRNILCPTNTVDVHISSLRRKIKLFENSDFIRTVPCVGYILENNY